MENPYPHSDLLAGVGIWGQCWQAGVFAQPWVGQVEEFGALQ